MLGTVYPHQFFVSGDAATLFLFSRLTGRVQGFVHPHPSSSFVCVPSTLARRERMKVMSQRPWQETTAVDLSYQLLGRFFVAFPPKSPLKKHTSPSPPLSPQRTATFRMSNLCRQTGACTGGLRRKPGHELRPHSVEVSRSSVVPRA